MSPDIPSLALSPFPGKEDLWLVPCTDAIRLCREGGYEKLPLDQALSRLVAPARNLRAPAREFARRTRIVLSVAACDDVALWGRLRDLVRVGALVPVRTADVSLAGESSELVTQRQAIRAATSGGKPLRFEGRTFRLVAGADLPRLRDRDDYHVVPQAEAQRVLDGLAATTPAAKTGSFREARKLLAHDWRPPLAPDGIVLLRKVAEPKGPSPKPEPGSAPGRAAAAAASAPAAEEKEQEPLHPCPATLAQASQDGSPFCAACTRHG